MAEDKTENATVLRHVGVDDAAQGQVEVLSPVTEQGYRRDQSGSVEQVGEVAGNLYPPEDDPMAETLKDRETVPFRKQYVVAPAPGGNYGITDCSADICTDALNMGYRPAGPARIEGSQNHPDGLNKIITWVVPVKPVGGKAPDELDAVADKTPVNETLRYGDARSEPSAAEQERAKPKTREPEAKPDSTVEKLAAKMRTSKKD